MTENNGYSNSSPIDWASRPRGRARRSILRLRFEQPWQQWLLVFTFLLAAALIGWLYWHEGKASRASKLFLASLRTGARASGDVHAFRRLFFRSGGRGLPYLTILVDDSASGRIADQYEKPEDRTALEAIAAPAKSEQTTQAGDRQGPDPQGSLSADP